MASELDKRRLAPNWHAIPNIVDNLPWYKNAGLIKLNFIISVIYMGQMLDGYDGTILSGLQALPYWKADLNYPNASRIGLLNAMSYISGMLSGPFISWSADRFGRRFTYRYYAFTMITGTVLGSIAGTVQGNGGYALFCVSKFIIGSGLACSLMVGMTVLQEVAHPRYRSFTASLFNQNWTLGHCIGAAITFGTSYIKSSWSWRIPYLIQLPLALYLLIAIQLIPETPRWLFSKGRKEEARAFLVKYHANGDPNDQLVQFEIAEIEETLASETAAMAQKWKGILAVPSNRHRLCLAGLMTFCPNFNGTSVISLYYSAVFALVGITQTSTVTGIGLGLSGIGWIGQFFGVWSMARVTRRKHVMGTWIVLALFYVALIVAYAMFANSGKKNLHGGIAGVVFVWAITAVNAYALPVYYSYPAEILPYNLRAKGMGVWNTVNQSVGVIGAYCNSVALAAIGYKYFFMYLALIVVQWFLLFFFFRETKGLTLEEIAIAFEGADSAVAKVDAGLEGGDIGVVNDGPVLDSDSKEKM